MKKTLLCSLLFIGVVQAGTRTTSPKTTTKEKKVAKTTRSMDGFFVGLGLQYTRSNNDIKATDGVDADNKPISVDTEIAHRRSGQPGATLLLGYGKTFREFYLGGEALLDVNKSSKVNGTYESNGAVHSYSAEANKIVPSVAVRIGHQFPAINSAVYAKFGASMAVLRSEFQETSNYVQNNVRRMNKVTPIIGLGFERKIRKQLNVRGEFEYRMPVKNITQTKINANVGYYNVENRFKGMAFRVMLVHRFI